jgi:sigma-B regulation protein RsbU (phosphoserine phosphatase)
MHMPADRASQWMQCMEVWGGNAAVDTSVVISGLDAWIYARPYKDAEGGGDVYYVSSCATGRVTRLLLADVSGHGSDVADIAGKLRSLMRRNVNFLDQGRFVNELNSQFTELSDAGCFATALAMTFFGPTRRLTLCNAGHPPPLLYRAATGRWEYVQRDGRSGNLPWGIETICTYDQFDVPLAVGDMVLCYTDSLPEARVSGHDLLGAAEVLSILQKLPVDPPGELIGRLIAAIEQRGTLHEDDATILLFRPNAFASEPPTGQRLLAPVRLLSAFVKSLRPGGEPMAWPQISLSNIGGAVFPALNRLHRARVSTKKAEE